MALIKKLESLKMSRNSVHEEAHCTFTVFIADDGSKYLQIDTYGSSARQLKGKKSQSLQFDLESIEALKRILAREF